mgnify:CR=1 FL=1
MKKVKNITKKIDSIFKHLRGFEKEEYEKVLFNIELLKNKHYIKKYKKTETKLFEHKSFKSFIKNI